MQRLAISTDVFVPPEAVFAFLVDFPGYAAYSEYLERVERRGDGTDGTVYEITVAWWRLRKTVRSAVTDVDRPRRIDWRLLGPIDASGAWVIDAHDSPAAAQTAEAPPDADHACRVTLLIDYDPGTVDDAGLDLPAFLSVDGLVDRLAPVVEDEAEETVARIVADLEGAPRPVDVHVESGTDAAPDRRV